MVGAQAAEACAAPTCPHPPARMGDALWHCVAYTHPSDSSPGTFPVKKRKKKIKIREKITRIAQMCCRQPVLCWMGVAWA